jgi:hypothetical protein
MAHGDNVHHFFVRYRVAGTIYPVTERRDAKVNLGGHSPVLIHYDDVLHA